MTSIHLVEALGKREAVSDGRNEASKVDEGGNTVQLAKRLVKGKHLLRVRRLVVALLPILLLYTGC